MGSDLILFFQREALETRLCHCIKSRNGSFFNFVFKQSNTHLEASKTLEQAHLCEFGSRKLAQPSKFFASYPYRGYKLTLQTYCLVMSRDIDPKMAVGSIRGRSQMLFTLLFVLCLSPIHGLDYDKSSSLIEEKCAYGDYENVNVKFGGKYFLSHSNCGADVPLKDVNEKQPPSVTFTDAVSITFYI